MKIKKLRKQEMVTTFSCKTQVSKSYILLFCNVQDCNQAISKKKKSGASMYHTVNKFTLERRIILFFKTMLQFEHICG